jgi:hypothetical protein
MEQLIAIILPYDLANSEWSTVLLVYRNMDNWVEGQPIPCWLGPLDSALYIAASAQPNGLPIPGNIEPLQFRG